MTYDILPLRTAFFWIILSTLLISGSAGAGLWLYKWQKKAAATDVKYLITTVAQPADSVLALPNDYLEELLGLAADRPAFLTAFNVKNGEKKLLASPCIKDAKLKKVMPGTLFVSYRMRKPKAAVAEYANVLVDNEGVAFPSHPFYPEERRPLLVLGDIGGEVVWGESLKSSSLPLALDVLDTLCEKCKQEGILLKQVDVSKVNAAGAGQREIVVVLEEFAEGKSPFVYFLQLGIDQYERDLHNFWRLRHRLLADRFFLAGQGVVVDLRVPQLAFLSEVH